MRVKTSGFIALLIIMACAVAVRAQDNESLTETQQIAIDQGLSWFIPPVWRLETYTSDGGTGIAEWYADSFGIVVSAQYYPYAEPTAPTTSARIAEAFTDDWFDGVFINSSEWSYQTQKCEYEEGVFWQFYDSRESGDYITRYWVEPVDREHIFAYLIVYHAGASTVVPNFISQLWFPNSADCWADS